MYYYLLIKLKGHHDYYDLTVAIRESDLSWLTFWASEA